MEISIPNRDRGSRVYAPLRRHDLASAKRLRRPLVIGMVPLVAAAVYTFSDMLQSAISDPALIELTFAFGFLLTVTISFAYYVLVRFNSLHQPPFVWACLLLLESVVSPLFDWNTETYPISDTVFVQSMPLGLVMCAIFTLGLWLGIALWVRHRGVVNYPLELAAPDTLHVGFGPLAACLALGVVSFAAEAFIIVKSGVLDGDLNNARTLGLIGTTLLQPVVRLTDIGSLLASWMSLVADGRRTRRQYFLVAIFCMLVSMIMPALLQQRFGLIQAVLYFILPRIALSRNIFEPRRKLILAALPLGLVLFYTTNEISSIARSLFLGGRELAAENLFYREAGKGSLMTQSTHFRHTWLLGDLLSKGFDEDPVGGIYHETAFIGDILLPMPRALFPEKPVTTMEVVNGVMIGSWFSETNREDSPSVLTAGLWIQLFLLGGRLGLFPLAALFAYGSLWLWDFGMRRTFRPEYVVMAVGVWFVTGWLAFNVALTTLEVPGIVLGMMIAHGMPKLRSGNIQRSRPRAV